MIKVKGYRKKGPSNILNILIILMIAIVVVPVATEKIREKSRSDSLLSETDGTLQIEIPLKDKTDVESIAAYATDRTLVRIDDQHRLRKDIGARSGYVWAESMSTEGRAGVIFPSRTSTGYILKTLLPAQRLELMTGANISQQAPRSFR